MKYYAALKNYKMYANVSVLKQNFVSVYMEREKPITIMLGDLILIYMWVHACRKDFISHAGQKILWWYIQNLTVVSMAASMIFSSFVITCILSVFYSGQVKPAQYVFKSFFLILQKKCVFEFFTEITCGRIMTPFFLYRAYETCLESVSRSDII